jgi:hypothetical protein
MTTTPSSDDRQNVPDVRSRKPSAWAGSWYFVVTILSVGLLAWLPFVHAARRLHRRYVMVLALVYGTLSLLLFILLALTPADLADHTGDVTATISGLLMFAVVIAACVQQALVRKEVYAVPVVRPVDPALAAALSARERRTAARQLVANDLLLAGDLHIGRPDLPHTYDDGGLVDLNNAPAAAIAQACGLNPQVAESIVATRTTCGGFLTVDDVLTMVDVPISAWDLVRDRAIVLPMTS